AKRLIAVRCALYGTTTSSRAGSSVGVRPPDRPLPAVGLPRRLLVALGCGRRPIALPFYGAGFHAPRPSLGLSVRLSPSARERVRKGDTNALEKPGSQAPLGNQISLALPPACAGAAHGLGPNASGCRRRRSPQRSRNAGASSGIRPAPLAPMRWPPSSSAS